MLSLPCMLFPYLEPIVASSVMPLVAVSGAWSLNFSQQFTERLENTAVMKHNPHLKGNQGWFILTQTWVVITKKHKFRLP